MIKKFLLTMNVFFMLFFLFIFPIPIASFVLAITLGVQIAKIIKLKKEQKITE